MILPFSLKPVRWSLVTCRFLAISAFLGATMLPSLAAARSPSSLAARIDQLIDTPPFDRATWAAIVTDSSGRVLYERNADHLMVPASNNKLLIASAALNVLGPSYRISTSIYGGGPLENGVLHGDLVIYGRGDPGYSDHCYGTRTQGSGACDSLWTGIDALADDLVARGLKRVEGAIVGDGSYFEPHLTHGAWEQYDLNWWYAAPVSGLGFNDNSVDITWKPAARIDATAMVTFEPDLGLFTFKNRSRTTPAGTPRTLDFYREPGTMAIWSEGNVPIDDGGLTEYFALPDPNSYFAQALRSRLVQRGVSIAGPTLSTTDSLRYRPARQGVALASRSSRPVSDMIFPVLNTSQNWFAEMLLKLLGRERGGAGSWEQGLKAERHFLVERVAVDSTAFSTVDGSGLAKGNLITARALTQILRYSRVGPGKESFSRALPRSGGPGSLKRRFIGTALEGRVVAKTGSVDHVQTLAGFIERPRGGELVFSVMVNNYGGDSAPVLAQVDSVVVAMGK